MQTRQLGFDGTVKDFVAYTSDQTAAQRIIDFDLDANMSTRVSSKTLL